MAFGGVGFDEGLVESAFLGDGSRSVLGACCFASRHHQFATLLTGGHIDPRDLRGGFAQCREQKPASRMCGVTVAVGRGPHDGAVDSLAISQAA